MFSPTHNAIWIPLGILHYPFFLKSRLNIINFATAGTVIGHELTHGFDNFGALFDLHGSYNVSSTF